MGFRLPEKARKYYEGIFNDKDATGHKLRILFDLYYFCLLVGLKSGRIGSDEKLESEFLDYYPGPYSKIDAQVAGLLIDAEMLRTGVDGTDGKELEKLILGLVDYQSKTLLSRQGVDYLNRYAAKGFEILREKIDPTNDLESFLLQYHNLVNGSLAMD